MSVIELEEKHIRRKLSRIGNSITLKRVTELPENVRPEVLLLFAETLKEYGDAIQTLKDK